MFFYRFLDGKAYHWPLHGFCLFHKLLHGAVFHAPGLAVAHAGGNGVLAFGYALGTEIAHGGGERHKIHLDPVLAAGVNMLRNLDTEHALRIAVFLLAGDRAGKAARAVFYVNE